MRLPVPCPSEYAHPALDPDSERGQQVARDITEALLDIEDRLDREHAAATRRADPRPA